MARSVVGSKPFGYEYWGKRKGSYWVDRKTSHKMERMQLKEEDRDIIKDALFELGEGNNDLSRWKEKADMMEQGASVAYEHAYWMLKDVL